MSRQAPGAYLNPNEVQIVHAVQRRVRRAFLCGADLVSGEFHEQQAVIMLRASIANNTRPT